MTPRSTPLTDRLAELREQAHAAATRAREVQAEREQAKARTDELREQIVEAFAQGEDEKARKLQGQVEQAGAVLWDERVAGAERAYARAQADRDGFVASNYAGLVREREPGARKAARRVEDALRELVQARQEWHAEAQAQVELTRAVGNLDGRSIPDLGGVDGLVRQARPLIGSVPVPLPLPVAGELAVESSNVEAVR